MSTLTYPTSINLRSEQQLAETNPGYTTGELAERLYAGMTYDTALPQPWVDWCQERGFDPRGRVVWGYPNNRGIPLPLTVEALIALISISH